MESRTYIYNTVIVGSGAAAFNAADTLFDLGQKDIAIVTEGVNMGTSRNTGSDKQTYYKLSLSGGQKDSVHLLAETLFAGGSMHGDTALAEAASSVRCFFKLVQLGVPFPCDTYGQYAGYKTDHDPMLRGTSGGPLTSKYMTECLEDSVRRKGIPIYNGHRVVKIFTEEEKGVSGVQGLLALHTGAETPEGETVCFWCKNIIWAVGGPAGMYFSSVYPTSQTGASGTAFEAGASGNNLGEWQYGIASVKFRWNLSGAYQQVIPRYVSTDQAGKDEQEFLDAYFETPGEMLNAIFLKGYQWPFDPRKTAKGGSSVIDQAVYHEQKVRNRRVFLDYRRNPSCALKDGMFDWTLLGEEAETYLKNSGAMVENPIDRLQAMNRPAYDLYKNHRIDLEQEMLEIGICAQHNNGGLKVDKWWQSDLKNFFPVGEAAGTLGVYRPGGTALNSTQVGSMRAAQYIAKHCQGRPELTESFHRKCRQAEEKLQAMYDRMREPGEEKRVPLEWRKQYQKEMDACGGILRESRTIDRQIQRIRTYREEFCEKTRVQNIQQLKQALINWDILTAQLVYLTAMKDYIDRGGSSRGSYLIQKTDGTDVFCEGKDPFADSVQEITYDRHSGKMTVAYVPVRPLPDGEVWFEEIYRKDQIEV